MAWGHHYGATQKGFLMKTELSTLIRKYPRQPKDVLRAFIKAQEQLESQGLPANSDSIYDDMHLVDHAKDVGLLDDFTNDEIRIFRLLTRARSFQYRTRATIANLCEMSEYLVSQAIEKLKDAGLLAYAHRTGSSAVFAFTDTPLMSAKQIAAMKEGLPLKQSVSSIPMKQDEAIKQPLQNAKTVSRMVLTPNGMEPRSVLAR